MSTSEEKAGHKDLVTSMGVTGRTCIRLRCSTLLMRIRGGHARDEAAACARRSQPHMARLAAEFQRRMAGLLVYRNRPMLRLCMMKHLAEIVHVEILPAYRAVFEMLRLGLDWPVVILTSAPAIPSRLLPSQSLPLALMSSRPCSIVTPFSRAKCSAS